MTTNFIFTILAGHWLADFVCQTDYMALNKSRSNKALLLHVSVYTVVMLGFVGTAVGFSQSLIIWVLMNFALHFVTDFVTSRLNAWLWSKEMRHWFFVSIGFDQLIHYFCLFGTYSY